MFVARPILVLVLGLPLAGLGVACTPSSSCVEGDGPCMLAHGANGAGADAGADASAAAELPQCTVFGSTHIGLGGEDVAAKLNGPLSGDRARVKPYSALQTEYSRVLGGNAPSLLASSGPTFGIAADRWFLEPIASAVFVDTAFNVAFEGCLGLTGNEAKYKTAPTSDSARAECAGWARKFWSREATPDQLDACASVATTTTSETYDTTESATPPRQWAYACASILTATPFLTY